MNDKNNLYIIAIVGIVAVIGIVMMVASYSKHNIYGSDGSTVSDNSASASSSTDQFGQVIAAGGKAAACVGTSSQTCSVGVGACKRTGTQTRTCRSGKWTDWSSCPAKAGSPTTETCNGIDDNCNGKIDEGLSQTQKCSDGINSQTKTCKAGVWTAWSSCPTTCSAESNASICARQYKTCGIVTSNDNCGTSRTVVCGTCSSTQTCTNNVCAQATNNTNTTLQLSLGLGDMKVVTFNGQTFTMKLVSLDDATGAYGIQLNGRWAYAYSLGLELPILNYISIKGISYSTIQSGVQSVKIQFLTNNYILTNTCSDTDNGRTYNTSGKVTYNGQTYTDYCSGSQVFEYTCENDVQAPYTIIMKGLWYQCSNGCSNGACVQSTNVTQTCTDTDGGRNYDVQGTINDPTHYTNPSTRTDYCLKDSPNDNALNYITGSPVNYLIEMYCNSTNNKIIGMSEIHLCPNGCSNGACVQATNVTSCGDKICNSGETCSSCPTDCGTCTNITTCNGANDQNCTVVNGVGIQSRTCTKGLWSSWSSCSVQSCNAGFVLSGNSCIAACTDSDGGLTYYTQGHIKGYFKDQNPMTSPFEGDDYCECGGGACNYLYEYSCQGGYINQTTYNCPKGCINGACSQKLITSGDTSSIQ